MKITCSEVVLLLMHAEKLSCGVFFLLNSQTVLLPQFHIKCFADRLAYYQELIDAVRWLCLSMGLFVYSVLPLM